MKELLKTLFFVAVALSKRSVKLAAVVREDINFSGNSLVLPLRANFIVKNQAGQQHTLSTIAIPKLPGSTLCPNKAVSEYNKAILITDLLKQTSIYSGFGPALITHRATATSTFHIPVQ